MSLYLFAVSFRADRFIETPLMKFPFSVLKVLKMHFDFTNKHTDQGRRSVSVLKLNCLSGFSTFFTALI